jgi:DNA sulfur modification protein DndC
MPTDEVPMSKPTDAPRPSAFSELGFKKTIALLIERIQDLYRTDSIPWVIGYSGGKDSTAVLQLIWMAVKHLPPDERTKSVHVISTDTLVENPVVASWVSYSLETMQKAATDQQLPIHPNRLTPELHDTFWVNLIGRGYPAPRLKFRWCTARLKISPSNTFIRNMVKSSGEAILVLGTRKAESAARARNMLKHEQKRMRDFLSPNATLPNCLVFTPVEDWSNDDVWTFLMQTPNPWGYNNKDLLTMYQGASEDGECPLVVDSSTPSCGDSRFGCWVCTLVEKDKSMAAMIQNDEEKEWMLPLLQLRNELDIPDDKHLRDFRRMSGNVQLFHDTPIHGPYTQEARENWLRKLLSAQTWVRKNGPAHVRGIELITMPELVEIRRLWVLEKHEIEDSLPTIYREETGEAFPHGSFDDGRVFSAEDIRLLKNSCPDQLHYELTRELIDVARKYRTMARRAGLFGALEDAFQRGFYTDVDDATEFARRKRDALEAAQRGDTSQLDLLGTAQPPSLQKDSVG